MRNSSQFQVVFFVLLLSACSTGNKKFIDSPEVETKKESCKQSKVGCEAISENTIHPNFENIQLLKNMCDLKSIKCCIEVADRYYTKNKFDLAGDYYGQACKLKDEPSCQKAKATKDSFRTNMITNLRSGCTSGDKTSCNSLIEEGGFDFQNINEKTGDAMLDVLCERFSKDSCHLKGLSLENEGKVLEAYDAYKYSCKIKNIESCSKVTSLKAIVIRINTQENLEKKCAEGSGKSCFDLAEVYSKTNPDQLKKTLDKSCSLSFAKACEMELQVSIKINDIDTAVESARILCSMNKKDACQKFSSFKSLQLEQERVNTERAALEEQKRANNIRERIAVQNQQNYYEEKRRQAIRESIDAFQRAFTPTPRPASLNCQARTYMIGNQAYTDTNCN